MTADWTRLARLHAAAFPGGIGWTPSEIAAFAENGLLIAREDGFALFSRAADESELLTLAVGPWARRRGLGRELLREGMARLAGFGVRRLFLEVAEDNAAALGLYESEGFEEIARRQRYYRRGPGRVDAIVMELRLGPPPALPGRDSEPGG